MLLTIYQEDVEREIEEFKSKNNYITDVRWQIRVLDKCRTKLILSYCINGAPEVQSISM